MPSATQANAAARSTEEVKAEAMDVDTQESAKDDPDKTPTKVKQETAESAVKTEVLEDDEKIEARGMLLVGGRGEMEGPSAPTHRVVSFASVDAACRI